MAINKNKLVYDTTDGGDVVGSYLRASDGTLLTHTDVGGKKSLDVNVANTVSVSATDLDIRDLDAAQDNVAISDGTDTLEINADGSINSVVTATDLDIRDLSHVSDSVKVGDGTDFLAVNADGSVNITDNGGSLTVDAVDLDIRDLSFATDSVDVSGSEVSLDAATLAALENITVSATDLDIRDLTHVSDSIRIGDGTDFLAINADGSINVNADISVVTGFEKAEDAAHVSGDIGGFVLSVRQDSLSASAGDGDYQAFKTDALGRLYTNDAAQSIAHSAVSVGSTATDLVATDLVNRKRVLVQNRGNKEAFIGGPSVTIANGIELPVGASIELEAGAAVNLHAITSSGTTDVRVLELA